ncbi:Membrane-bound transcription factor site-2 like protein [Argiope bruennichi]|uniref:Membrane-bound transcription factor site-2 protease n=1 Tax=Argiope bruennichi TaxID=94029 RepID=A0A8T0FAP2_ARGBR|nr:Membrane-bound transcription factor site-2 like protein [Argiope bruennichi]
MMTGLPYSCRLFPVHEFGHALAASREKVPIEGFGLAIFGIFPMAYVRMSVEHLRQINISQQLRIYSAGIWHNLVLAAVALALLSTSPFILKPLYQQGNGVTVIDVKQDSGLGQKGGLMKEDTLIGVNECLVQTENNWKSCIHQEYAKLQSGFCVHEAFYKKEDIAVKKNGTSSDCCPETNKNMCFRFSDHDLDQLMCLPARELAENAKMCVDHQDCWREFCLIPVLESKSERFLRIKLSSKRAVFYVGPIEEIFSSVAVSPWVSNYAAVCYADMFELLLGYIFSFSCGLAILNTIPLFWLDGNYIIECVINGYLKSFISEFSCRYMLIFTFKIVGCIGLLFSILISLLKFDIYKFNEF